MYQLFINFRTLNIPIKEDKPDVSQTTNHVHGESLYKQLEQMEEKVKELFATKDTSKKQTDRKMQQIIIY